MVEVEGEDVDEAKKKREERHKEKREGSCHTAHYEQHMFRGALMCNIIFMSEP